MMVKNKGFTLVELLVVISVIALLMGIIVPVLAKARAAASRTYCKSNLREIGVIFRAYLDDNRDIMPPASDYPWDITDPHNDPNNPDYMPPITKFLGPLLHEPKVFICKADTVETPPYHLRTGNTSYQYNERLGGTAISASRPAKEGIKERNINVMNDFVSIPLPHGGINYLYADWHVGDNKNQD